MLTSLTFSSTCCAYECQHRTWKEIEISTHHVRVPVERLHARKQLFVVAKRDEDLCVVPHGLLEDGQRALADLVLLQLAQLSLV